MTQVASKIGAVNTLRDNPGEGFVKEDVLAVTAWAQLLLEVLPGEGKPEAAMKIGTTPSQVILPSSFRLVLKRDE
jgi:hypothetical protein